MLVDMRDHKFKYKLAIFKKTYKVDTPLLTTLGIIKSDV